MVGAKVFKLSDTIYLYGKRELNSYMEFSIVKFLSVVLVMAFANVCGTLYFSNVEKERVLKAAFWSAMLILVNAFSIINYVENNIYIAAAVIGTYLGTFGTIKWMQRKEKNPELGN